MNWLFALILCAAPPASDLSKAKELTYNNAHKEALVVLSKIKIKEVDYNDYCYFKAINHFSLNQKKDAEYWIDKLLDTFDPLPNRYRVVAELMKYDMETWKENDLGDVSRDMEIIKNRL